MNIILPSDKRILADKSFPYNTYAMLILNSDFNQENETYYIYNKDIEKRVTNFLEESNGKIPSMKTIKKHIKIMLEYDLPLLKVENSPHGVVYKLTPAIDNKCYVRLPYQQVKELILADNKNILKLFVVLASMCDTENYRAMDKKFLVRQLGLSDKSKREINIISAMLKLLRERNYIDFKLVNDEYVKDNKVRNRTVNAYRLRINNL